MDINYLVIQPIYDMLNNHCKKLIGLFEENEKNLFEAKEIGDLSENSSYANAITRRELLSEYIKLDQNYLEECKIVTRGKLIAEGYGNMYSVYKLKITNMTENEPQVAETEALLIPKLSIEGIEGLDLKTIQVDTVVGQLLMNTNNSKIWMEIENKSKIKVEVLDVCFYENFKK